MRGAEHPFVIPALVKEPIGKTCFLHDGHFTPQAHRIAADEIRKPNAYGSVGRITIARVCREATDID